MCQYVPKRKAWNAPSLTFMAGVMPDVSASSLHPLELVQQHFIRPPWASAATLSLFFCSRRRGYGLSAFAVPTSCSGT